MQAARDRAMRAAVPESPALCALFSHVNSSFASNNVNKRMFTTIFQKISRLKRKIESAIIYRNGKKGELTYGTVLRKKAIVESFIRLLNQKPLDKITVKRDRR